MKTRILIAAIIISAAGFSTCSQKKDAGLLSRGEYYTRTGKMIVFTESHPAGQSLSTIHIRTVDFEHNFDETFTNVDPVSDILMADLDSNGFDELYVITTASGSGSYGKVMGFASNMDKSLSMIAYPETEGDLQGYMGHDVFFIEEGTLVRTFPVFKDGDVNAKATGGTRRFSYGLFPGEASWQLRLVKTETGD